MKAIQMTEFGGPEVLKLKEIPEPVPGPGEVRVRLSAAGVNPSETYVRTGTYSFYVPALPCTLGFDGAGMVDEVGPGVTHVKEGDRVFVAAMADPINTGTYAQKVVTSGDSVHPLPEFISFAQGASLGVPALAAYRALFQRARLKPGETVLIHGASGGVGILCVQMASAMGAKVIGTASTPEGQKLILQAGGHHAIPHVTMETLDQVMQITGGEGPDVIVEFLANVNLQTDLKVIAPYGRIVIAGNRGSIEVEPRLAMQKEADLLGMALWNATPGEYQESLQAVAAWLQAGILHPQVGTVIPLAEASRAHQLILMQKAAGKMVLEID